jgi:hypothetical protein
MHVQSKCYRRKASFCNSPRDADDRVTRFCSATHILRRGLLYRRMGFNLDYDVVAPMRLLLPDAYNPYVTIVVQYIVIGRHITFRINEADFALSILLYTPPE